MGWRPRPSGFEVELPLRVRRSRSRRFLGKGNANTARLRQTLMLSLVTDEDGFVAKVRAVCSAPKWRREESEYLAPWGEAELWASG
jgi:hypothetical protein